MGFFDGFFRSGSKQKTEDQTSKVPNVASEKVIPTVTIPELNPKVAPPQEVPQTNLNSIVQISPVPKSEKSLKKLAEELTELEKDAADLQLKIDKAQDSEKAKFSVRKTTLQMQIADLEPKIDKQRITLDKWISAASTQLAKAQTEAKNKQFQKLKDELDKAKKQVREYETFVKRQEKETEGKIEAQEESYNKKKEAVKRLISSIIADPKKLDDILQPLLSSSKDNAGIGIIDKGHTVVKTLGFILNNKDLKISDIITVVRQNPAFFKEFMQDKDFKDFLNEQVAGKLDEVVKRLVPTLADIAVKELSNENVIRREHESKKKELAELPQLKKNFEELEAQLKNPNNNLEEQEKLNLSEKISSLQMKIASLQDLLDKAKRVETLKTLGSAGLDQKYIQNKLVPIITDISNKVLSDGENLILLIRSAAKYALTNDQQEKKVALRQVLSAINTETLLNDSQLVTFLQEEGQTLAKGAIAVASSNETIKSALNTYGVKDKLVTDIIPIITQTAGNILANPAQVQQVFKALVSIILDDTNDRLAQIKGKDSEMEAAISQGRVQKVAVLANALPGLILQDNVLSTINAQLVQVIEKNKENISEIVIQLTTPKKSDIQNLAADEIVQPADNKDQALEEVLANNSLPTQSTSFIEKLAPKTYQEVVSLGIDVAKSAIPLVTQAAAALATDTKRVKEVVNALAPIILDDTATRLKDIKDPVERNQLEEARTEKILGLAKVLPALVLQDNVVSILNEQLARVLEANRTNIAKIIPQLITPKKDDVVTADKDKVPEVVLTNSALPDTAEIVQPADNKDQALERVPAKKSPPIQSTSFLEKLAPKTYQEVVSLGIDVAKSAIPLVTQTAATLAEDTERVNAVVDALAPIILDDTATRLKDIKDPVERNQLEEARTEKILGLAKVVPRLILQHDVIGTLNKQLVGILETNKENISNLAPTIVPQLGLKLPEGITSENYRSVVSLGIDVVTSAIPLVIQTAAAFAKDSAQVDNLIATYTQFTEYKKVTQDLNAEQGDQKNLESQQQQLTRGLLAQGTEIFNSSAFQDLLTSELPKYLKNGAKSISQSNQLTNILESNTQLLKDRDIDIPLGDVKQGIEVGLEFASAALPVLNKIVQNSLSEPDKIMKIINGVNGLMTEDTKTKRTPEQEKTFRAEKTKKLSALVSTIMDLKNSSPELQKAIDEDLPKLLTEHSKALGGVIDNVLKDTKIGQKLNVKAEAIIKVASNHLPQITEVADLYSKRKYASMIPKVAQLIFNKDVMQLAGKAIFGLIKPKTLSHGKATENEEEISKAAKVITNNKGKIPSSQGSLPPKPPSKITSMQL